MFVCFSDGALCPDAFGSLCKMSGMKDEDWESKQLEAQIEKHKQDKRTNKIATVAVALTVSLLPSCMLCFVHLMSRTLRAL